MLFFFVFIFCGLAFGARRGAVGSGTSDWHWRGVYVSTELGFLVLHPNFELVAVSGSAHVTAGWEALELSLSCARTVRQDMLVVAILHREAVEQIWHLSILSSGW